MKALQFDRLGTLDHLHLIDRPRPQPGSGEALVQVRAAGLNPSDVKNVLGRFPYTTLPRIPGRDFAGVVVAGPAEMIGREVWGTGRDLGFFRDGSHAEYLTLPAAGLSLKPQSLSFEQAASCGVPFTTALDALDRSGVTAGTHLLVIGAGAVGDAAIQLARARGARIVAAVRRAEQATALEQAGIKTLLLDDGKNLTASIKTHFPSGAEAIFDTTGFWLPAAVDALAPFGRIAVIAAPVDGHVHMPILALYRRGGSIVGINSLLYDAAACAAMLTRMAPQFDRGLLRAPASLQIIPLSEGLNAYQLVNRGGAAKTVLQMA
ncbi:MAG: quinone oxidoreductase family protein [Stenotrophobium sp.]